MHGQQVNEMASSTIRIDPRTGKKIPPPVAPKPIRMTATKLTRASFTPKPASAGKDAEAELDALTDLLVKNLENTGDPDFFGKRIIIMLYLLYRSAGNCANVLWNFVYNTDV